MERGCVLNDGVHLGNEPLLHLGNVILRRLQNVLSQCASTCSVALRLGWPNGPLPPRATMSGSSPRPRATFQILFSIQPFGPQPANAREHEAIVVGMYRIEVFEMIPAFRDNVRKTNVLEGIGILVGQLIGSKCCRLMIQISHQAFASDGASLFTDDELPHG